MAVRDRLLVFQNIDNFKIDFCVAAHCRNCRRPIYIEHRPVCDACLDRQRCVRCRRYLHQRCFVDNPTICQACSKRDTTTRRAIDGIFEAHTMDATPADDDVAIYFRDREAAIRTTLRDALNRQRYVSYII
jgi:hypothetical protein